VKRAPQPGQLVEQVVKEQQGQVGGEHLAGLRGSHEDSHLQQLAGLGQQLPPHDAGERAPLQEVLRHDVGVRLWALLVSQGRLFQPVNSKGGWKSGMDVFQTAASGDLCWEAGRAMVLGFLPKI